jgi:hypothetical protein
LELFDQREELFALADGTVLVMGWVLDGTTKTMEHRWQVRFVLRGVQLNAAW